MAGITLHTARQVVPMIYAYTTPEIARHNGWTKIGYTEQSVDKRHSCLCAVRACACYYRYTMLCKLYGSLYNLCMLLH